MQKRFIPPWQAGRVRLRLLEADDLPRTLAGRNQDHVRRWFFDRARLTHQQHAAWFAHYRQRDDDFVFIIEEACDEGSRHTPCAVRLAAPAEGSIQELEVYGGRDTTRKRVPGACYLPIGQAAVYNIDWVNGTAEFGRLMIGEAEAARRGLAREATRAVVSLAFRQLALREVHLEVMPSNVRAIRVYEACGFEVTGSTERAVRMSKSIDGREP